MVRGYEKNAFILLLRPNMPYSKEHKQASYQKILDSAIRLFSTKGFDQVSIDDLMKDAGLTRGAFYSHFKNKKALYSKAIIAGARKSRIMNPKPENMTQQEWTKDLLFGYISKEHIDQQLSPCPLAFLVTDIANNEEEVKTTYTRMYKQLNKALQIQLKENLKQTEEDIMATTAMMIGAVAIGRALTDENTTEKLLNSCRLKAMDLLRLEE